MRIQSTFAYFKKSATKAKKWLAVTANRFHRSRHGLNPPVPSEPSEKPLSRPSTPLSTTLSVPPPIPLIYKPIPLVYKSVELSLLTTTPMFVPLDNSVNNHTLPSISRTSLTRSAASSGPSSTTISLMDIDTSPLLTPPFLRSHYDHYETNHHDPPPCSTLTTFAESSKVLDVVTPEIESQGHNTIEVVRDIHRRSPTPTSQRQSAQLYVSMPPVPNPVTHLAPRSPRPYAYVNRNILPPSPPASHAAKKRAFSVSAVDECTVQPFKRSRFLPTPPCSTLTTFAESSKVLDVVTPEIESQGHNTIEVVRDIHRRSPTPTSQRQSAQLYVSLPPVPNPVTHLASRSPRPYAYVNRNILPPSPPASHIVDFRKRAFSESVHYEDTASHIVDFRKRAFSESVHYEDTVKAYKRYKLSSPGRLFLANIFPDLCSTRYDYGWSLHGDEVYVFSASCPTTAHAKRNVDGSTKA